MAGWSMFTMPDGAAELAAKQLRFLYRLLVLADVKTAEALLPVRREEIVQAAARWQSDRGKG